MNQFKKEEKKVYIFFDEINTSNVIGLISEMMCNRTLKGRKLNDNLYFIAACNPYRIKKSFNINYGLNVFNDFNKNNYLDYKVFPIPISLLNFTFDFGNLSNEDEIKYIKAMITQRKINQNLINNIIELISFSQKYFRQKINEYSVSLRDIKRFCLIYQIFNNNYFDK